MPSNPMFGEAAVDEDDDEHIEGFGGSDALGWGSAATASNIDAIFLSHAREEEEEDDATGFGEQGQWDDRSASTGKLRRSSPSNRSGSSIDSDEEDATGFGEFATARSVSPPHENNDAEEERDAPGFGDASVELEAAYAAGLAAPVTEDPVAAAADEKSRREFEKTHAAGINKGLVVVGEMNWGGYDDDGSAEAAGEGEALQYDEPDWAEEFDEEDEWNDGRINQDAGVGAAEEPSHGATSSPESDGTVMTIADFKLAAKPIGFGYEDFEIKNQDVHHDADSLSNFVPRSLDTVFEEEEPTESEMAESLNGPPEDSEHHGWIQLYVVRSGKNLTKRPKWRDRWCKLKNGKLTFQMSPNAEVSPEDTKILDVSSIQHILGDESGENPDRFIMESARQTYMVLTRSEDATHEWITELLKAKHYAKFARSRAGSPVI